MANKVRPPRHKLEIGSRVTGTVYRILPNRILLRLPEGVHGIIRQREFSWDDPAADPFKLAKVGTKVAAVVLNADPKNRHVELSLRSAEHDPWKDLARRYPEGHLVEGTVVEVRKFGAFVRIEPGIDGLIPLGELRLGEKPQQAQEVLWPGDLVRALVKDINPAARKIALSIREYLESQVETRQQEERSSTSRASLARFLDPATARKLRQRIGDLPPDVVWAKPEKIQTVLIADDDNVFRDALALELRDAGYDVIEAIDHPSALDAVKRRRFDLAILDLSLSVPAPLSLGKEIAKAQPTTRVSV